MKRPYVHLPRRKLARIISGGAAALLGLAVVLLPGTAQAATQECSDNTGTFDGSYFTMYVSGGSACMTLNSGSSYSTTWSGIGDFVGGIGFNPGSTSQSLSFNGSMSDSGGTALMSLYGWSTNPLVEYYVEEDYVGSPNAAGTFEGTVTSNGGTYNIYEHQQVNQPCITGNSCTFEQYLAIRTSPVTSGTITFQNFVNAWASHGMDLGTMNYQVLATEAYNGGSGSSSVTLGGGGGSTNTVTVTDPGNQSGTVGTAVSKQISASDSGGAALTYSATGLPAGLSINSSGLISGTPTSAGTSTVTVTAQDSTGASGSTTFTWTVSSSGGGGSGGGTCQVVYTTTDQWTGGFTAQVVITNNGTTATNGWTLNFTFGGNQQLTSDYNGSFSQSGEAATLTSASYNGDIAPGGNATVGFQGTWTSSDAVPTSFTLNGTTCST
jgi:endo-1,4-beta-xylanase